MSFWTSSESPPSAKELYEKLKKALDVGFGSKEKLIPEPLDAGLALMVHKKDENGNIISRGATHEELAEYSSNCISCIDYYDNDIHFPNIHKDHLNEWLAENPKRRVCDSENGIWEKSTEGEWQKVKN